MLVSVWLCVCSYPIAHEYIIHAFVRYWIRTATWVLVYNELRAYSNVTESLLLIRSIACVKPLLSKIDQKQHGDSTRSPNCCIPHTTPGMCGKRKKGSSTALLLLSGLGILTRFKPWKENTEANSLKPLLYMSVERIFKIVQLRRIIQAFHIDAQTHD